MPAVDRVDGVIDGPLHHREVQLRDVRRLAGAGNRRGGCVDQRIRGVEIPVSDRVGALRRFSRASASERCGERDERYESGKRAAACPSVRAVSEHGTASFG
jgi:hypothetical protein